VPFDYHLFILVSKGVRMARARDLMAAALREALRSRRISPTRACKNAGLHDDALNAVFRGARSLPLDEVDRILDAHEIPLDEILGFMISACQPSQVSPDPVAIVAGFRELPQPCHPDLRIWLTLVPTIGSGDAPADLPALVKEIEEIRSKDRSEAFERARIWVSTFRHRLRGASRGQSFRAEAVCEFAVALGMWGWIADSVGLNNDACFAIEHALRLHRAFPLSQGFGRLLHWATFLALPAGNPSSGGALAEQALLTFISIGDAKSQIAALAALAAMKSYCGHDIQAARISGAILASPLATSDHRFAAHLLRVQCALTGGDLFTARNDLSEARRLLPSLRAHCEPYLNWWSGKIELASHNSKAARLIFSSLLHSEPNVLEPSDRFLVFLDLAEALKLEEDFVSLKVEAKEMQQWLPSLDVSPLNRAIIVTLTQTVLQRMPEETELNEARAALAKGRRGRAPRS